MQNKLLLESMEIPIGDIIPYPGNSRKNQDTVNVVAQSIQHYGFCQPIVIDNNNVIVAGHTRFKAAKELGLETVPVVRFTGTEADAKEYRLMDNRCQENSGWHTELLASEFKDLDDSLPTGFTSEEISKICSNEGLTLYAPPTVFDLIIEVEDEVKQQELYDEVTQEGGRCRVLSI